MTTELLAPPLPTEVVATNADDVPVLYASVRTNRFRGGDQKAQLEAALRASHDPIAFALIVDPQTIQVFRWDGAKLEFLRQMPTREVFRFYDPDVEPGEIYPLYMERLVEGWLRDFAYGWKSQEPPYLEELRRVGLPQALENGFTFSQSLLAK